MSPGKESVSCAHTAEQLGLCDQTLCKCVGGLPDIENADISVRHLDYIEKQTKKGFGFSKSAPVDNGITADMRDIYNLKLLAKILPSKIG